MANDVNAQLADLARRLKAAEAKAAEAEKRAEEARKEADAAKARGAKAFSLKVGEKGGVVMSGIKGAHSRFGLTLYPVTLQEIFSRKAEIEAFIAERHDDLSWEKPETVKA